MHCCEIQKIKISQHQATVMIQNQDLDIFNGFIKKCLHNKFIINLGKQRKNSGLTGWNWNLQFHLFYVTIKHNWNDKLATTLNDSDLLFNIIHAYNVLLYNILSVFNLILLLFYQSMSILLDSW